MPDKEKIKQEEASLVNINDLSKTQGELAEKLNVTKSYISRIKNGVITPSVTVFYRIIEALGMRVEIVKPIY